MADQESILAPAGGMNGDDSSLNANKGDGGISRFQAGDYRYALNARIGSSTEANVGALENIASTLLVNNFYQWDGSAFVSGTAPAGTNTAIGRCEDIANGKVFWPVYNSGGNHVLLMWVKSEKKIYELLRWTGLAFNLQYLVSSCLINKYLIFTDNLNPPRIIDVTTIYTLKSALGSNFSEYHISFAKWPPLAPPVIWSNYTGTPTADLKKGLFQFAYRYIFIGGFKSTWSPPSSFVSAQFKPIDITSFRMEIPGFTFDYTTPANTAFANTDIRFYQAVQYIEFAYRESSIGSWKLFKRYTVGLASVSDIPAIFANNGPSATIAQNDIGQYFDTVPLLSGSVEAIDNRPMFGNNLDEFTAPVFTVNTIEIYSVLPTIANTWLSPGSNFGGLSPTEQTILEVQTNCKQYSFKERGIYKLGVVFQHYSGRMSLVCTQDDWTYTIPDGLADNPYGTEYLHALGFKITSTPPDWAVAYEIVRSNALNFEFFVEGYVNDFKFLRSDLNGLTDWLQTPTEIKDILNNLANGFPNLGTFTNLNSGVPTLDQITKDPTVATNFLNQLKKTADQNNLLSLSTRIASAIRKNKLTTFSSNSGYIYMDISNWLLPSVAAGGASDNPPNNVFYNFQQGDRVAFFGSKSVNYANSDLVRFDEEIVQYTGQGIIVKRPSDLVTLKSRTQETTNQRVNSFLIEIYRRKTFAESEEVIFNEIGEWYPITQPTTPSRAFSKTDFTWTDCNSVTVSSIAGNRVYNKMPIYEGDAHVVKKVFYSTPLGASTGTVGGNFIQMNQDKDNAAGFWEHNTGRAFVAYQYPPVQLRKATQVRFGGKFLENSVFIAINTFLEDNQYIYPSEYGTIRALVNTSNTQVESIGNILLAIGEDQPWSIYVNRVTIQDLAGRTQVGLSDKVLGSYNTLLGGHGTLNGESVSKNNGRVIWWNAKKGTWVRYSRDGLTAISQIYNMKNWFNDLAGLIIDKYGTSENPKAISVQDNYHETWLTALNHSTLPSTFKGYASYKCAEFHESQDEWKTIFDYMPDVFARLDNDVYSIIGCAVHIHEEGTDYGSFYGVKKDSAIEFISNQQPRQNKVWNYLNLQASDKWSFPSIKGDFKSNGATIQETQILLANLVTREGLFVVDILRDQNSVNKTTPIVEGDVMRGRSLDLYMKLDPSVTWLTVFNYLGIGYTMSEKNLKK